jgi:outer membrane protein assembly factor BamB
VAQDPLENADRPQRRPIRWWPAWIILLLATTATAGIRSWPSFSHQQKNIFTAEVVILSIPLILLWVLLLSRMWWRTRLIVFACIALPIAFVSSSFRIRGVSGDLLPILEWRFQSNGRPDFRGEDSLVKTTVRPEAPVLSSTNDYPQFLGPRRDGVVEGPALARDWSLHPPQLIWSHPIGAGWSGFAVAGSSAVTQEQSGERELVTCYDLNSGQLVWSHADAAHYNTTIAGEGPRTTPTVASNRVYSLGATGILNCLELTTGRVIWSKNVVGENHGSVEEWGMSCAPLVLDRCVVVTTGAGEGRSLAAYASGDGAVLWTAGHDEASYSSPVRARLAGTDQILIFNAHSIAGHDAHSGSVLWESPWPGGHPHIATPLQVGTDQVLISSGYGTGSELLQVRRTAQGGWTAQRVWKSIRLKSKFANLIAYRDQIYGLDDGILVCLETATGKLDWKGERYGHGQLILTGGLLLVMAENGEVVLVDPTPEAPRELTRFRALPGKTWNPPALAGACLVVRNDRDAACYRLPRIEEKAN